MIDVCLPPSWHARVTIAALEGRQARLLREADRAQGRPTAERMVEAARAGRQAAVDRPRAAVLSRNIHFAYKTIAGGKYGQLLGGHFKRIISDPAWLPDFFDPEKVGGPMLDLHVHDAHFIRLVCGMPKAGAKRGHDARRSGRAVLARSSSSTIRRLSSRPPAA